MEPHAAAFNNSSLIGSLTFGTTGLTSTSLPDITLGAVTIISNGNYALTADENSGGAITINKIAGTYNVEPNGRVTLTGGNHPPVLYLSGLNSGYSLGSEGRGTLSIASGLHTGASVFYQTGHSPLVLLNSNNAGDITPMLFRGGCIHFVIGPRGG